MRYVAMLMLWLAGTGVTTLVPGAQSMETEKLLQVANEYRERLAIRARVHVKIVVKNQRLASVRPVPRKKNQYLLEIDENFLATLNEEEKRAIIAHEIGHVWIFTHHPNVQSEALANEKAQGLISRESLASLYRKVWTLDGEPGKLDAYLSHRIGSPASQQPEAEGIPALLPGSSKSR